MFGIKQIISIFIVDFQIGDVRCIHGVRMLNNESIEKWNLQYEHKTEYLLFKSMLHSSTIFKSNKVAQKKSTPCNADQKAVFGAPFLVEISWEFLKMIQKLLACCSNDNCVKSVLQAMLHGFNFLHISFKQKIVVPYNNTFLKAKYIIIGSFK